MSTRRPYPAGKAVLYEREKERLDRIHKKNLEQTKATIDQEPPRSYAHLATNGKKQYLDEERCRQIERDNLHLLGRITSIMGRPMETMSILEPKGPVSLNYVARQRELARINAENRKILAGIQRSSTTGGTINVAAMEADHLRHVKCVASHCNKPVVLKGIPPGLHGGGDPSVLKRVYQVDRADQRTRMASPSKKAQGQAYTTSGAAQPVEDDEERTVASHASTSGPTFITQPDQIRDSNLQDDHEARAETSSSSHSSSSSSSSSSSAPDDNADIQIPLGLERENCDTDSLGMGTSGPNGFSPRYVPQDHQNPNVIDNGGEQPDEYNDQRSISPEEGVKESDLSTETGAGEHGMIDSQKTGSEVEDDENEHEHKDRGNESDTRMGSDLRGDISVPKEEKSNDSSSSSSSSSASSN